MPLGNSVQELLTLAKEYSDVTSLKWERWSPGAKMMPVNHEVQWKFGIGVWDTHWVVLSEEKWGRFKTKTAWYNTKILNGTQVNKREKISIKKIKIVF